MSNHNWWSLKLSDMARKRHMLTIWWRFWGILSFNRYMGLLVLHHPFPHDKIQKLSSFVLLFLCFFVLSFLSFMWNSQSKITRQPNPWGTTIHLSPKFIPSCEWLIERMWGNDKLTSFRYCVMKIKSSWINHLSFMFIFWPCILSHKVLNHFLKHSTKKIHYEETRSRIAMSCTR